MLTKEGLDFILHVTDYFHGHYEDPEWGRRGFDQVLVLLSVHTLAEGIADVEVRQSVKATLEKEIVQTAQQIVKRSTQDPVPPAPRRPG